jgi:cytochrome b6-f complex iron-sulfur subunit
MTEMSTKTREKAPDKMAEIMKGETLNFMTTRRRVLRGVWAFFLAIGLGGVFYGLYRFLAPGGGTSPLLEIPLSEIPPGGTYPVQYGGSPGILIQEGDGSFRAFSLVCPHLACTVVWNPEKKEFQCPCHDALFDAQGSVLSGPSPSPLERWKIQVQNDRVLVGGG